jgi:hypothetical protein
VHDVLIIVRVIKERLELKLKVDLNGIEFPNPCDLEGEENIKETNEDGINENENIKRNEINNKFGSSIMMDASSQGYERIRTALKADNKIDLPSVCKLNKQLPLQVECLDFTIDDNCNGSTGGIKKKDQKCKERNEVLLYHHTLMQNFDFQTG